LNHDDLIFEDNLCITMKLLAGGSTHCIIVKAFKFTVFLVKNNWYKCLLSSQINFVTHTQAMVVIDYLNTMKCTTISSYHYYYYFVTLVIVCITKIYPAYKITS